MTDNRGMPSSAYAYPMGQQSYTQFSPHQRIVVIDPLVAQEASFTMGASQSHLPDFGGFGLPGGFGPAGINPYQGTVNQAQQLTDQANLFLKSLPQNTTSFVPNNSMARADEAIRVATMNAQRILNDPASGGGPPQGQTQVTTGRGNLGNINLTMGPPQRVNQNQLAGINPSLAQAARVEQVVQAEINNLMSGLSTS
ncbi:MAG: hypothetical protein KTR14_02290 [Vampirovibrio sp.]|nr:hypothetical protein [Vampirovibrio sp.]